MATIPLPADPDLGQLKRRAREFQRSVRAGDAEALAIVVEHHPNASRVDASKFPLTSAQLVLAHQHGFRSWTRLKRYLDEVSRSSRSPDTVDVRTHHDDEFLRLACLTYGDDGPQRWGAARQMVEQDDTIGTTSIWAAAARADVGTLTRELDLDREPRQSHRRSLRVAATAVRDLCPTRPDDQQGGSAGDRGPADRSAAPTRMPATSGTACRPR